ncbi:MAG TPA: TolC family protein [Candidatus Limnocylindria bacterium]|jgi:outer membrane protein TolC|nr:TolC family protein [Candidatus Limnocylindria bacterium]
MNLHRPFLTLTIALALGTAVFAADAPAPAPWPTAPLTLKDALELTLSRNPDLLKGKQDIEEAYGLAVQLRGVVTPKLSASGAYNIIDEGRIEKVPFGAPGTAGVAFQKDQNWNAGIGISQPLYSGGKLTSSLRSAKLTKEAAVANYQALVADTLLNVRIAYQDVLLAAEQIVTQEASTELLTKELTDTKRRYDAGTVPRFNVLRAEVELANAKPKLFRARSAYRIAKNNLATLLGWNIPENTGADIPLTLAGKLESEPYETDLPSAIAKAVQHRPEITVRRLSEKLRKEDVTQAKSGYIPTVSAVAGYGWVSRNFSPSLADEVHGWSAGAVVNWDIWDFGITQGKVSAAKARQEKARIDTDDTFRRIEQEVRTAHSNFLEAKEVLESQAKVIEQGEEALRLANARADAGSGTQLDVLSAQTALTDARTTYSQALRDYTVARARLDRAMGEGTSLRAEK